MPSTAFGNRAPGEERRVLPAVHPAPHDAVGNAYRSGHLLEQLLPFAGWIYVLSWASWLRLLSTSWAKAEAVRARCNSDPRESKKFNRKT